MSAPDRRMLTAAEAAHYCGFESPDTFKRVARVPPVNFGKYVRYDRHRIDQWLDTLTEQGVDVMDIVEAAGNAERPYRRN